MIPILYESNETAFINNGLGRLRDCISAKVSEERNSIYELDFEYPTTGVHYSDIKLGRIVAVEHDDSSDLQPFDIVSYSRPINGIVTFHCQHISYRQSKLTVSGTNINSLADAFAMLGNSSPANPFSYWTDKPSTGFMAAADGVPRSVRQMLGGVEGSILDTYGGEYEWDKFTVRLHSSRGEHRTTTIRYGVNLTEYNEEVDYSGSYTAVIPFWTGDDGNGGTAIIKGSMVDSGVTSQDGRVACVPLDLTDKFENQPTVEDLTKAAQSVLASNTPYLPSQNIKVSFIRLQDTNEYAEYASLMTCKLCDTINVVFPLYGLSGNFKIVKTVYDVLLERFDEMELGTLSVTLSEALGVGNDSSYHGTGGGGGGGAVSGVKGNAETTYRTGNVNLTPGNIGAVPTSRTVNGHALSSNVTVTASDIGVESGAEVNQNAFSNVKVGSTTIAADTKTDTLELVAGSNVTLTADATNDKITIDATDTTYSDATTTTSGLMSAADKTRFDEMDGVYFGGCLSTAGTVAKTANVPGVTELYAGLTIVVSFLYSNTASNPTLNVNSLGAVAIKRYGTTAPGTSAAASWNADSCVMLAYDGQYWRMVDYNNTTYSAMSVSEMQTGTATTGRVITAARLKAAVEYHALVKDVKVNGTSVVSSDIAEVTIPTIPTEISDLTNDMVYDLGTITPTAGSGQFTITETQRTDIAAMWAKGLCAVTFTVDGKTYYAIKEGVITSNSLDFYGFGGAYAQLNALGLPYTGTALLGICSTANVGICGLVDDITEDDAETIASGVVGSEVKNFSAIAVNGQTSITPTTDADTLTIEAGANVTLTTSGKTLTISAGGGGESAVLGVKGNAESTYRTGSVNLTPANIGAVPTTRTVNGKALSSNISLTAADVGAIATTHPANGITSTDITNWDNAYDGNIAFDTTAQSGDDYNLTTILTTLGWLNDVIV